MQNLETQISSEGQTEIQQDFDRENLPDLVVTVESKISNEVIVDEEKNDGKPDNNEDIVELLGGDKSQWVESSNSEDNVAELFSDGKYYFSTDTEKKYPLEKNDGDIEMLELDGKTVAIVFKAVEPNKIMAYTFSRETNKPEEIEPEENRVNILDDEVTEPVTEISDEVTLVLDDSPLLKTQPPKFLELSNLERNENEENIAEGATDEAAEIEITTPFFLPLQPTLINNLSAAANTSKIQSSVSGPEGTKFIENLEPLSRAAEKNLETIINFENEIFTGYSTETTFRNDKAEKGRQKTTSVETKIITMEQVQNKTNKNEQTDKPEPLKLFSIRRASTRLTEPRLHSSQTTLRLLAELIHQTGAQQPSKQTTIQKIKSQHQNKEVVYQIEPQQPSTPPETLPEFPTKTVIQTTQPRSSNLKSKNNVAATRVMEAAHQTDTQHPPTKPLLPKTGNQTAPHLSVHHSKAVIKSQSSPDKIWQQPVEIPEKDPGYNPSYPWGSGNKHVALAIKAKIEYRPGQTNPPQEPQIDSPLPPQQDSQITNILKIISRPQTKAPPTSEPKGPNLSPLLPKPQQSETLTQVTAIQDRINFNAAAPEQLRQKEVVEYLSKTIPEQATTNLSNHYDTAIKPLVVSLENKVFGQKSQPAMAAQSDDHPAIQVINIDKNNLKLTA